MPGLPFADWRRQSAGLWGALLISICGAGIALGAERKFPTQVALGTAVPYGSEEGLDSPVVYLDHESAGYYGAGLLRIRLNTAVLITEMSHPVLPALTFAYKARLAAYVEGAPFAIYRGGVRLREQTFRANSGGIVLVGRFFPKDSWGFNLEGEHRRHHFNNNKDTGIGFVLPRDFSSNELRVSLEYRGLFSEEGAKISLLGDLGRRRNWADWTLDDSATDKAAYHRAGIRMEQPLRWSEFHVSKIDLRAGTGRHLDLFSGYWVGGIFGQQPVGGYFRQEYRAKRFGLLEVSHKLIFAKDRILTLNGAVAWLQELDLNYLAGHPTSRTLGSVGFAFRYGIRSLKGLPIFFRYAEGLNVPGNSLESHRREVMVLLAAGF